MLSWLKKLWNARFWTRSCGCASNSCSHPFRPHTLIVAATYAQAREYAVHHFPYHEDWRYISHEDQLRGYSKARLIMLDEWETGKTRLFITSVKSAERLFSKK